jgi:hypothetical protein
MTVGLANQRPIRIGFDPVQPRGQRSHYKLQLEAHWTDLAADGSADDAPASLTAELDTIATSSATDGGWTLGYTFKSLNLRCDGDECSSVWDATKSAGFSLNLDNHGKVVSWFGSDSEDRAPEEADLVVITDVLLYLLPTIVLPRRPVAAGERWAIDETTSPRSENEDESDGHESDLDRLRGTGTLKGIAGDLAFIEIEFARELYVSDDFQKPDLIESGSGNMILTYDLCHARFVKIQLRSVMATVESAYSENHVQTILDHIFTIQLLKQ